MGVGADQMRANLLAKARAQAADKSVASRLWHTKGLHSIRSAVSSKGAFASKASGLAAAVGRTALSFIPIPGVAITGGMFNPVNYVSLSLNNENKFSNKYYNG